MTTPVENLPNRIRALRKAAGLTLRDLAERPGVGMHYAHISNIETGERELNKVVMDRLAAALGVPQADLLLPAEGGLDEAERALIRAYRAAPAGIRSAMDALAASTQPGTAEVTQLHPRKSA